MKWKFFELEKKDDGWNIILKKDKIRNENFTFVIFEKNKVKKREKIAAVYLDEEFEEIYAPESGKVICYLHKFEIKIKK